MKLTKELKQYKKKYEEEAQLEKPSAELAKAWLDNKIEYRKELDRLSREFDFGLCWGEYNNTDPYTYDNKVSVCYNNRQYKKEIHIGDGIKLLADLLGEKLICKDRDDEDYPYEYSFIYNDYTIFQISEEVLDEE